MTANQWLTMMWWCLALQFVGIAGMFATEGTANVAAGVLWLTAFLGWAVAAVKGLRS